jgi:hypothetical protein
MRSIAIWSVSTAIAFAVMGAVIIVWWYGFFPHRPIFKAYPPQTIEFVRSTSDIEHLRKFTQLVIRGEEVVGKKANETLDAAINMISVMAFVCASFALFGWGYALKARNLALGTPMPRWLRWL